MLLTRPGLPSMAPPTSASTSCHLTPKRQYASHGDSLQFQGHLDDLEKNRKEFDQQLFEEYLDKNMETLTGPLLPVGKKTLTGLDLLEFITELKESRVYDYQSISTMLEKLFPQSERIKNYATLLNIFRKLSVMGSIRLTEHSNTVAIDSEYRREYSIYVEDKGKRVLQNKAYCLRAKQPNQAKAPEKADNSAKATPGLSEKFEMYALLSGASVQGLGGWTLLSRLNEIDSSRNGLSRYFWPGLTEQDLKTALPSSDPETFRKQLDGLSRFQLLTQKSHPKDSRKNRWLLTPKAQELLKKSDFQETCGITKADIQAAIAQQIQRLEVRKTQLSGRVQLAEEALKKSVQDLATLQAQYETERQGAIEAYDKVATLTDRSERDKLKLTAAEKAMNANLLARRIQRNNELHRLLTTRLDSVYTECSTDQFKLHIRIKELEDFRSELESSEVTQGILETLRKLKGEGSAQENEMGTMDGVLNSLLGGLQGQFTQSRAELIAADPQLALQAEKTTLDVRLDDAIEALKSKATADNATTLKAETDLSTRLQQSPDETQNSNT